jgi:hypothetical protein
MLRLLLRSIILLLSTAVIASFALTALHHASDVSTDDPGEKAILEGAQRMAVGEALYDESGMSATPAPMPGYTYAIFFAAGGHDLRLRQLRALGIGVALALALVVASLVQLESGSFTLALTSGSFVLLGLDFAPGFPAAARPEVLMLLLVILGFSVLRFTQGIWGALLATPFFASAYFVDQQTGWFLAVAFLSLGLEKRARLLAFALASGLLVGGGFIFFSQKLGSWFNFNAWDAPLGMLRVHFGGALRYVSDFLLGKSAVWVLAGLLAFAMPTQPWKGKRGMWMFFALAALASGLYFTQTSAFEPRLLIPAMIALAMLGPIMVQRVARHLSAGQDPDLPSSDGVIVVAVALQLLVVLTSLRFDRWWPDLADLTRLRL